PLSDCLGDLGEHLDDAPGIVEVPPLHHTPCSAELRSGMRDLHMNMLNHAVELAKPRLQHVKDAISDEVLWGRGARGRSAQPVECGVSLSARFRIKLARDGGALARLLFQDELPVGLF